MALNPSDNLRLGEVGNRAMKISLGVGIVGVVISLLLVKTVPIDRYLRAYLTAFMLVLGISLAGLIFTMIWHATRAGWAVVVRRLFEVTASNLLWLWILFIPIAVAMFMSTSTHLYEWAIPSIVEKDAILQGKEAYLNPTFWLVRAVIFFAVWALLARFYLGNSVAQDENGDLEYTHRMQRWAPIGILLFAFTLTMAAFDWIMSLSPHWFSTIFGVYTFAASAAALYSFLILMIFFLQRAGKLKDVITPEHYQDMGKLLFAFGIVFWAYIGFSQFMLIWYANIPEETMWFMIRSQAGWKTVSYLLILGHFLIPFLAIMSRYVKRNPPVIAAAAAWMLLMAFVDFYWLVVPKIPEDLVLAMQQDATMGYAGFVAALETGTIPAAALEHMGIHSDDPVTYREIFGFNLKLVDITWLVGMLGLLVSGTLFRMSKYSLVARQDPRISESLAFENM